MDENNYDIQIYTCPRCKKQFPNISNSAPNADGELCVQCYCKGAIEREEENKDNWIPCTPHDIKNGTGRIPSLDDCKSRDYSSNEKFGSFIVTTVSGCELRDRGVSQACFRIGENKSFWYRDGTDMREKDNVIAWQPLPESYKGEIKDFKLE